jgi:CDP-glucose 4,6-dehydratase
MTRVLPDPGFWSGRRVLVTGHTGFKGRWLTLWLRTLGADVTGFSRRDGGDVTDAAAIRAAVAGANPEVVFHLAGLATVQLGYDDPAAVHTVNVVGTANVLQAVRGSDSVRAVIGVTSDK